MRGSLDRMTQKLSITREDKKEYTESSFSKSKLSDFDLSSSRNLPINNISVCYKTKESNLGSQG